MPKKKPKDSVIPSEKWGLNPTIPVCWYCNKEKNRLVMLGKTGEGLARLLGHEDGKMPRSTLLPLDFEPCEECRKTGIGFIEAAKKEGPPAPTGRVWLVKTEAAEKILDAETLAQVKGIGFIFIPRELVADAGLCTEENMKEGSEDVKASNP